MVDKEPVHISEIVKPAWKAPNGVILPDYVYPLVRQFQILQERSPESFIFGVEKMVTPEIKKEVLGLLEERLKYLNDGIPTLDLSVLPLEEYKIFSKANILSLPHYEGKAGTGKAQQVIDAENSLLSLLKKQVDKAYYVSGQDILNETQNKNLKRMANLEISGVYPILLFLGLVVGLPVTAVGIISGGASFLIPAAITVGTIISSFFSLLAFGGHAAQKKVAKQLIRKRAEVSKHLAISYLVSSSPVLTEKGKIRGS